jgi:hypothetical protein
MMRIVAVAVLTAFAGIWLAGTTAQAQTPPSGIKLAQAAADNEGQPRQRPTRRLRIYPRNQGEPDGVYPRYFPGRNAVRDCTATYAQEYRPSGTVIVPRMNCYWRPG